MPLSARATGAVMVTSTVAVPPAGTVSGGSHEEGGHEGVRAGGQRRDVAEVVGHVCGAAVRDGEGAGGRAGLALTQGELARLDLGGGEYGVGDLDQAGALTVDVVEEPEGRV